MKLSCTRTLFVAFLLTGALSAADTTLEQPSEQRGAIASYGPRAPHDVIQRAFTMRGSAIGALEQAFYTTYEPVFYGEPTRLSDFHANIKTLDAQCKATPELNDTQREAFTAFNTYWLLHTPPHVQAEPWSWKKRIAVGGSITALLLALASLLYKQRHGQYLPDAVHRGLAPVTEPVKQRYALVQKHYADRRSADDYISDVRDYVTAHALAGDPEVQGIERQLNNAYVHYKKTFSWFPGFHDTATAAKIKNEIDRLKKSVNDTRAQQAARAEAESLRVAEEERIAQEKKRREEEEKKRREEEEKKRAAKERVVADREKRLKALAAQAKKAAEAPKEQPVVAPALAPAPASGPTAAQRAKARQDREEALRAIVNHAYLDDLQVQISRAENELQKDSIPVPADIGTQYALVANYVRPENDPVSIVPHLLDVIAIERATAGDGVNLSEVNGAETLADEITALANTLDRIHLSGLTPPATTGASGDISSAGSTDDIARRLLVEEQNSEYRNAVGEDQVRDLANSAKTITAIQNKLRQLQNMAPRIRQLVAEHQQAQAMRAIRGTPLAQERAARRARAADQALAARAAKAERLRNEEIARRRAERAAALEARLKKQSSGSASATHQAS